MKCLECGYINKFRKRYKNIKQNIEICTVCGTERDTNSTKTEAKQNE